MFLTGHIQKESSEFLYYKFSNNYLINYITINWINVNSNYNIYISNNCHIENTDFKFYNISDLFKTKNTSLLHQSNNSNNNIILNNFDKSCSEWSNIYSESFTYNINSFIQGISNFFKRIDSCLDNKCNNASKYYGNSILIEFQNIYPYETHYNIAEINIEAQRIDNIVDYINPQDSVINSNQQFDITFNYDVQITNNDFTSYYNEGGYTSTENYVEIEEFIIGFSLDNCQTLKYKLLFQEDKINNYYYLNKQITSPGIYLLCLSFVSNTDIYFNQSFLISIHDITGIYPTIIHKTSQTQLEINTTIQETTISYWIAVDEMNLCQESKYSETYVNSKIANFYNDAPNLNTYNVCMSINGDTWGVSSKQIKSVKPIIYRVSGCNDQHNLTINCPTEGNISLDIYGDYFFDYYPKPILHFGDNSTILNTIINTSHIKSILPEGTGDDINVRIEFLISSDEKELISYIQPNIGYVQGCEDSYPKTLNCPNNNKFKINIIGDNFGQKESTILVGEQICQNITHFSHRNISCILDGSRGQDISIYLIQYDGKISEGKNYLSYKECPVGQELLDNQCKLCNPGTYKNEISDSLCEKCIDGKYANNFGQDMCNYCPAGKKSSDGSTSCKNCGINFYKKDVSSINCEMCATNEYTKNENSTECLLCPVGKNVINNECKNCSLGMFKSKETDLSCEMCPDGKYNDDTGISECKSCPDNSISGPKRLDCLCNQNYYYQNGKCIECENTDYWGDKTYYCNRTGIHLQTLINVDGYWRANKESNNFYKCKVEEYCPSRLIINNTVQCKIYHTGVLCHHCISNYGKDGDGFCQPCPEEGDYATTRGIIALIFIILVLSYCGIVYMVLVLGNKYLNKSINKLSDGEIIDCKELKESTSSYNSNSTISDDSIDKKEKNKGGLLTSLGDNTFFNITRKLIARNFNKNNNDEDDKEDNKDGDKDGDKEGDEECGENKNEEDEEEDGIDISELSQEAFDKVKNKIPRFSFNMKAFEYISELQKTIQQKFKILISYVQIISILSLNLNIKWPQFIKDVINAFNTINLDVLDLTGEDYKCATKFNYYHNFIMYITLLPILVLLSYTTYYITKKICKNKHQNFYKKMWNRLIYLLVLITFIIYPGIANSILTIYKCEEIEHVWYLSADLSKECYNKEWELYAGLGGLFIFIYILGIPYFFYKILHHYKSKGLLRKKKVAYKFGFLYLGYKKEMWWFEILELTKKTILSASIIYLDETPTRIMLSIIICFSYLMYITYNQPLKDPNDAWLSMLSAIELFLLLFCALILEVNIDKQDAYDEAVFEGIIFMLLIGILIIGKYQIICSIFKIENFSDFCHKIYKGTFGKLLSKYKLCIKTIKEYKESRKKKESESIENGENESDNNSINSDISTDYTNENNYIIKYPSTLSLLSESNYFIDNQKENYYYENKQENYNNNEIKNICQPKNKKQLLGILNDKNILNLNPIITTFADNLIENITQNVYKEILEITTKNNLNKINIILDSESDNEEEIEIIVNHFKLEDNNNLLINESNI